MMFSNKPTPSITRRNLVKSAGAATALTLGGGFTWRGEPKTLKEGDAILVNQSSYGARLAKTATLLVASSTGRPQIGIAVQEFETGETVYQTDTRPSAVHKLGGSSLAAVDFSKLQKTGRYVLTSGDVSSAPFNIEEYPYQSLFATLGRAFYLQRCGVGLLDDATGLEHATCHNYDAELAHGDSINDKGRLINTNGGWHDAGDYGKYVATTALAVGELLSVFLRHPNLFADGDWHIPESGDGMPDLLSEMTVGLTWLFSMQRSDGAMYRKVAGKEWPAMNMLPDHDSQIRFIFGVSTSDTAMAAAAFEIGARAYEGRDDRLAAECNDAAERAWQFLESHPKFKTDRHWGDEDGSGPYFLNETAQERVDKASRDWALAERVINKPESKLVDRLERRIMRNTIHPVSWDRPTAIGFYNILSTNKSVRLSGARRLVRAKLRQASSSRLRVSQLSAFGLANPDFIWGFNRSSAQAGVMLAIAGRELKNQEMIDAAVRQADFILGNNPFDKSFVTQTGTRSVRNVHHRFAVAAGQTIPGLLVGGPNENVESGIAAPGNGIMSYVDDERSFATNEFAIDHNSALIALLSELNAANSEGALGQSWMDRLLDLWPW